MCFFIKIPELWKLWVKKIVGSVHHFWVGSWQIKAKARQARGTEQQQLDKSVNLPARLSANLPVFSQNTVIDKILILSLLKLLELHDEHFMFRNEMVLTSNIVILKHTGS